MTICEAVDRALCSILDFKIDRYDCTDKQNAYYTREVTSEGFSFANDDPNCLIEEFSIKVEVKVPDVATCNTEELATQRRAERLEPICLSLKQLTFLLYKLGFQLRRKATVNKYEEKPTDADCVLKARFTGTFERCESVKCDNSCYDEEKLGIKIKKSWKVQNRRTEALRKINPDKARKIAEAVKKVSK